MPLDTRIALGAQPIQLENPLAQYGQFMSAIHAGTQNQLAMQQVSAAQRAAEEEAGAKGYLSGKVDLSTPEGQRGLLAFGKTGLAYQKALAEQNKAKLESDKTAAEVLGLSHKNFNAANSPLAASANGIPGITAYVEALYQDPLLGPMAAKIKPKDQALKENLALYAESPEKWTLAHANLDGQHLLEALKTAEARRVEAEAAKLRPGYVDPNAPKPVAAALPQVTPTAPINNMRAEFLPVPNERNVNALDLGAGGAVYRVDGQEVPFAAYADAVRARNQAQGANAAIATTPDMTPAAAMAPAVAPAAATAPAVAPAVAVGQPDVLNNLKVKIQGLEDYRNKLLPNIGKSAALKSEWEDLGKQIDNLSKGFSVAPDSMHVLPGVGTVKGATAPGEMEKLALAEAAARNAGNTGLADVLAGQIKVKNQMRDERTPSQKEQAVLDDPNATSAQKANATSQLAKLNHIPPEAMSDFEKGLAASNLPETEKSKLRNAWLKSHSEHAPGTVVNIDQKQESAFATGLGTGQAKGVLESKTAAQDAADILATNEVGRSLLKSGAITGAGADFFVGLNKALKQGGIDFGYADAAANSQAYGAAMAANTGKLIKQFGAGTGISDADRDYATQAAAGKITMDEAAIRKVLNINDRAARNVIERHNKSVKGIKTNIPLEVEMPTFTPPAPAAAPTEARQTGLDKIFKGKP